MPDENNTTALHYRYVLSLFTHCRSIMLLQHRGQGLAVSDKHLLILTMLATLAVVATCMAAPSSSNPAIVGASFMAVVAFLSVQSGLGRAAPAGLCIIHIITEPACLLAIIFGLPQLNGIITIWVVVALGVFLFRLTFNQTVAKR